MRTHPSVAEPKTNAPLGPKPRILQHYSKGLVKSQSIRNTLNIKSLNTDIPKPNHISPKPEEHPKTLKA